MDFMSTYRAHRCTALLACLSLALVVTGVLFAVPYLPGLAMVSGVLFLSLTEVLRRLCRCPVCGEYALDSRWGIPDRCPHCGHSALLIPRDAESD